jgi:hypothetical protein
VHIVAIELFAAAFMESDPPKAANINLNSRKRSQGYYPESVLIAKISFPNELFYQERLQQEGKQQHVK